MAWHHFSVLESLKKQNETDILSNTENKQICWECAIIPSSTATQKDSPVGRASDDQKKFKKKTDSSHSLKESGCVIHWWR